MTVYVGDFADIPPFRYGLIMADPPWQFENWSYKGEHKNAAAKYDCMDIESIKRLNVGHIAKPDCVLWIWTTNPMLREGIAAMEAWGFQFKTAGHWVKKSSAGKLAFGTGYILRSAGEPFLIGTLGSPNTARNVRSVIEGPRREHSRKPEEAYAAAECLVPSVERIELFSRQPRVGWDTWGNEARKFSGEIEDPK